MGFYLFLPILVPITPNWGLLSCWLGLNQDRRYEENLKELQQRLILKQLFWESSVRATLFLFKATLKLRL